MLVCLPLTQLNIFQRIFSREAYRKKPSEFLSTWAQLLESSLCEQRIIFFSAGPHWVRSIYVDSMCSCSNAFSNLAACKLPHSQQPNEYLQWGFISWPNTWLHTGQDLHPSTQNIRKWFQVLHLASDKGQPSQSPTILTKDLETPHPILFGWPLWVQVTKTQPLFCFRTKQ